MDNPASPRTVPILVESGAVETFLLDRPGTVLSLLTYVQGKFSLTGVNLTAPDSVQGELKWEDYRYMRRSGSWSPGDEPGGRFVIASKDGKVVSNRGGAAVDMNISL